MLPIIEITDEDIHYAESILLPIGKVFDDERREFIRNLSTIDLQAVPGSGKTTALLAKLLILETKIPLHNGSGVLVLSHTNAAIDEVKENSTIIDNSISANANEMDVVKKMYSNNFLVFMHIFYYFLKQGGMI